MVKRKVVMIILAVGLSIGSAIGGYATARQPHMEAAFRSLHDAKAQLQLASHNKGGHRVEAIRLINRAIEEVDRGIAVGEN